MRWNLANGQLTNWDDVKEYADDHPKSRTAAIVDELTNRNVAPHGPELDGSDSDSDSSLGNNGQ